MALLETEIEDREFGGVCPSCLSVAIQLLYHGDSGCGFNPKCPPEIGSWSTDKYKCECCGTEFKVTSNRAKKQKAAFEMFVNDPNSNWRYCLS